jgi:tRNA(His) 5'-end guanylyltransferase
MRVYETAHDHCVLPGIHIVARLDGRSFTKLTKEKLDFKRPFDIRFRDAMVSTVEHLMDCGFKVVYGFTESDEISLLLDLSENAFGRKVRKMNTILSGEASAHFSLQLKSHCVFDSRICQLPNKNLVVDYFRWRNEDAHRNGLNAYCYWLLRDQGVDARSATAEFSKKSVADKNEFLFQNGVNFNEVAQWQKRGVGLYFEDYLKDAENPMTGEKVQAKRRRLKVDYELPMKDDYSKFVEAFLN